MGIMLAFAFLGALAFAVCGALIFFMTVSHTHAEQALRERDADLAAGRQDATPVPPADNPQPGPAPVSANPGPSLPSPRDTIKFGDIGVSIASVAVDFVPLEDFRGNGKSADKLLMVKLRLHNSSDSKKIDYHGWQPDFVGLLGEPASLADDKGNDYKRITFGIDKVAGRISRGESIYPGKEITDVLVFEEPVATCKYLILSLPSAALKADKDAKVRIPRSLWDPNAPTEKPPVETKPEPPVATPAEKLPPPTPKEEADAAAFLREAREFIKIGNRKLAGDDLRKVLADYPDTKAAVEARELLAALGQ